MTEEIELDLPAVMRDRREKLERLRASGIDPYSRGFMPTNTTEGARAVLFRARRCLQQSLERIEAAETDAA